MTIYGYACVYDTSLKEYEQITEMRGLNILPACIFVDEHSDEFSERSSYKELLEVLRPGDLLYIKSIDRLGQNYDEIQNQWRILTKERKVDIAVIDVPLLDTRLNKDFSNLHIADLVLEFLSAVAQSERNTNHRLKAKNILEGERGIRSGRPAINPPENFHEMAKQWEQGVMSTAELIEQTGLTESTLYRRLRELKISRQRRR